MRNNKLKLMMLFIAVSIFITGCGINTGGKEPSETIPGPSEDPV